MVIMMNKNKKLIMNIIDASNKNDVLNVRKNIVKVLTNKAINAIRLEKRKVAKELFK